MIHLKIHSGEKSIKDDKEDDTFENIQRKKIKKRRMIYLKIHYGEKSSKEDKEDDTNENSQWRKVKQR